MLLSAFAVSKKAGAFEHQLDTQLTVWKLHRVLLGSDVNALAIDDDVVAVCRHLPRKLSMHTVMLEQPRIGLCIGEVVHTDQLEAAVGTLPNCTGDKAADAAKS